jgi:hypothetical protein
MEAGLGSNHLVHSACDTRRVHHFHFRSIIPMGILELRTP